MSVFSIIVPIYNVEKYIHKCINSILEQTFKDFELILVNDGSPDKCGEICDNYQRKDNRIRVIHKSNGGLVSARNAGVEVAQGKYIGYVDGDDWVEKEWLKTLNSIIEKYKPDIVSYNAYKSCNGKDIKLNTSNFIGYYGEKDIKDKIIPYMLYDERQSFYSFGILPAVWANVIKREILKKNVCKNEKITFGEDAACTYNFILDAKSYVGIEENLYYYRQNRESMTKAYDKFRFERLDYLFKYLEENLKLKNQDLNKQYEYYKIFCLFYAILNEAKSKESLDVIARRCKEKMREYKFQNFIKDFNPKLNNILWKCFFNSMKREKYYNIVFICKIANKVKYSYKDNGAE